MSEQSRGEGVHQIEIFLTIMTQNNNKDSGEKKMENVWDWLSVTFPRGAIIYQYEISAKLIRPTKSIQNIIIPSYWWVQDQISRQIFKCILSCDLTISFEVVRSWKDFDMSSDKVIVIFWGSDELHLILSCLHVKTVPFWPFLTWLWHCQLLCRKYFKLF